MNELFQEFTKFLQQKGYIREESRGYLGDDTPRMNAITETFLESQENWIKISDVITMLEQYHTRTILDFQWMSLENSGMDKPLDMWDPFDKEEMLTKIRKERPTQTINKVINIEKNKYGFYDVYVNMESDFMGTTVKSTHTKLPYPLAKFTLLSDSEARKWIYDK